MLLLFGINAIREPDEHLFIPAERRPGNSCGEARRCNAARVEQHAQEHDFSEELAIKV
jgi:hypothetical protein